VESGKQTSVALRMEPEILLITALIESIRERATQSLIPLPLAGYVILQKATAVRESLFDGLERLINTWLRAQWPTSGVVSYEYERASDEASRPYTTHDYPRGRGYEEKAGAHH
jgi:hypothetical protein